MKDIIIWGAGILGITAFHYYKKTNNIVCFVDSDIKKWGTKIENKTIRQPSTILEYSEAHIVVAVKNNKQDIVEQLRKEYGIKSCSLFDIREELLSSQEVRQDVKISEETIIIRFCGGLGNQMFQYAFAALNQKFGKTVMADLSSYKKINVMDFELEQVFPKIRLVKCTEKQKESLLEQNMQQTGKYKKFIIYHEPSVYNVSEKKADMSLMNVTAGIFNGYFQSCKYAEDVRKILLEKFQFNKDKEDKLNEIEEYIKENLMISVHIRRGDYLTEINKQHYGNICTKSYYEDAMRYMKRRYPKSKFCFFSNDTAWVKENFDCEGNIVIEKEQFKHYEDWYDMYLMSLCRHNIIANSTFSWWGAWLNQYYEKTVIAPKKWINECEYLDICPKDWIRM